MKTDYTKRNKAIAEAVLQGATTRSIATKYNLTACRISAITARYCQKQDPGLYELLLDQTRTELKRRKAVYPALVLLRNAT